MARAIDVWESAFLYGEFDATVVSDSSTADVIVRGGTPEDKLQRLRLHSALRPECAGETQLDIDVATHELRLPIRVFVDPSSLPDDPGIEPCLALTSIHELGHAHRHLRSLGRPRGHHVRGTRKSICRATATSAQPKPPTTPSPISRPSGRSPFGGIELSYGRGRALIPARGMPIFPAPQEAAG